MLRPTTLLALSVVVSLVSPALPSAQGASRYTFADLGPMPSIGSSATSYMLSHQRRPTLDEGGHVTVGAAPEWFDARTPGARLAAITAPYTLSYGGLFPEVPGTEARVGYIAGTNQAPWQAMYWDQTAGAGQVLGGVLPPGVFSTATDVNRTGQIIGYHGNSSTGSSRPAAWTADGASWDPFAGVPEEAFGRSSGAYGLNDMGDIVGRFKSVSSYDSDGRPHAFLLTADGELSDLNDLVTLETGWLLESATDVNDLGQITGIARTPSNAFHAFLLTPQPVPEPAPFAVLAAGALIAFLRRARR